MDKKLCRRCNIFKTFDKFHFDKSKKDGHVTTCKDCVFERNKEWSKRHEVKAKKLQRTRSYLATKKGREKNRLAGIKFRATEKWRIYKLGDKIKKTRKISKSKQDPMKSYARIAVARAVKYGQLPKINDCICTNCNKKASQYHHFLGYEKENRLAVVPLCIRCHVNIHLKG